MTTGAGTVLTKKLSRIQGRGYSFPIQNRLAAKVEQSAARGATTALGVSVEAIVELSRMTRLAPLIDSLPTPGLFVVMQARSGVLALAGFDMGLVDHVVAILAGGDPNKVERLPPRKPTALDAALCIPAVDAIMNHLHTELEALGGEARPERFASIRTELVAADLSYLLPEQQYLSFRVNLDIGDDGCTGSFFLVLPLSWIEPVEAVLRRSTVAPAHSESAMWRQSMRNNVRLIRLRLNAVVDSFPLQVAEIARLEAGGMFPLSGCSLDDIKLRLQIAGESRAIATGRLGIHKRNKAIKIIQPLDGALFEELARELSED